MKKILTFIIFSLFSLALMSQSTDTIHGKYAWTDSISLLKYRSPLSEDSALTVDHITGRVKFVVRGVTMIAGPGVDSVTVAEDGTVCVYSGGVGTCYPLKGFIAHQTMNYNGKLILSYNIFGTLIDSVDIGKVDFYAKWPFRITDTLTGGAKLGSISQSFLDSLGGGGSVPTLQQVLDVQSANALLNKDDTITINGNQFLLGDVFGGNHNGIQIDDGDVSIRAAINSSGSYSSLQASSDVSNSTFYFQANRNSGKSTNIFGYSDAGVSSLAVQTDSFQIKSTLSGATNGMVWKLANSALGTGYWAAGSTGSVTSVATGLGLSGGTITTTGMLLVDTSSVSILSRQRAAATYLTTAVTSVATGLGLSGGTITTTGTLLVDTSSVSILSRQRAAATYQLLTGSASDSSFFWQKTGNVAASGSTFLGTLTKTSLSFRTNNALRMVIDSVGFVGIGVAGPTAKLSVAGNGTGLILMGDNTFTNFGTISLNGTLDASSYNFSSGGGANDLYINRPTGQSIRFREANGATDQMMLLTGGNVGIGTATPENKLDVNGGLSVLGGTAGGPGTSNGLHFSFASNVARIEAIQPGTGSRALQLSGSSITLTANSGAQIIMNTVGQLGIGTSATSLLTLKAGTASASTAPLKFTSGINLSVAEPGAMEYDGTKFYLTPSINRRTIAFLDTTETFTGVQTFTSIVSGVINTSSTSTSGNLTTGNTNALAAQVTAAQYITNSNNIQYRVGIRGSSSTVATAGDDVFALAIGDNSYTEAVSGTSALGGGLYIKTQSFTNGSGSTTDFQNFYSGDAPTGGTNNWSINSGLINDRDNLNFSTVGKGLIFKSGTGTRAGNATLVAGTVTVTNTSVTANTLITLTRKTSGGTIGTAITYTLSAGASFTINSDNPLDTSTFTYLLIESN